MLIASQEIAGIRQLIAAALKQGRSARAIVALIERAIDGLYSSRGGFSERDLNIAFLVKAIGGPCLLYALQKSHGLASDSTVHRKNKIPRLLPSIGEPCPDDINQNMSTFLDPSLKPPPTPYPRGLPGNIVMFDSLAIESKCRYCAQRNQVMGLCHEHAQNVNTAVTDEDVQERTHTHVPTTTHFLFGKSEF